MGNYYLLQSAAAMFSLAALGGGLMLGMRLSGLLRPAEWIAMGHGLVAASGLALLGYAVFTIDISTQVQLALAALTLAAIGGLAINVLFHRRRQPLPIPLVLIHGAIALIGLVLLFASLIS